MKQIKKIVLRDATKLTNSEMKNIRGGDKIVDNIISSSVTCSAACESGALKEYVYMDCSRIPEAICGIEYNEHETIATCFNMNGHKLSIEDCCGNPLPPLEV